MNKGIDYIVVGLGLAGACLSIQLLRRGKKIMVYDMPSQNRASSVAAGLFNPITGKRIVKTWKADEIFTYLHKFYGELEKELGVNFFYPTPLYTPFRSVEEQNEWMTKSSDASFRKYVTEVCLRPTFSEEVKDPLGGILLSQCGYMDTYVFLEQLRQYLNYHESYREETWDEAELADEGSQIQYKDLTAQKIIHCTGIHALENRFFKNFPLKALKGEVITIKTSASLNRIYNRGVYVIGTGENECKVGATYDLSNAENNTTTKGRIELEQKVKELLNIPFEVTHQDWGIRPSTIDRRPLMGVHPESKNVLIFNGMGTKGVSLAPYFSDQLAKYILGEGNLDKEANINRVKSLYSRFQ